MAALVTMTLGSELDETGATKDIGAKAVITTTPVQADIGQS
ncbi:hypothetical protein [Micromonospora sp. WMMD712]|nr:hypothetical protein [Micromonospora sp. WMMD712]WFE58617.1 hypothetical protein O7633_17965 [Micromonospora sp. WMMD712]